MNTLTHPEFTAFCKARGINPTKDTERAKAWRIPPVEVGERKPAQFVMRHYVRAEGPCNAKPSSAYGSGYWEDYPPKAELYTLHPTPGSAALIEGYHGLTWEPNPAPVHAEFVHNLNAWNPTPEEVAA